jgi:N-acetylglucosamine kinase-like BadF-type ATPase
MILIADSGSTKSSWALCDTKGRLLKDISTIGLNPYFIDSISITNHLRKSELNKYKNKIEYVFFYGAGCSSKEKKQIIASPFKEFFKNAKIKISHDLDAACFAMYKGKPNITCILGTGSNSCFYDGKKIYEHGPSLGFIMGDEASGNHFGKKIINLYFNNIMPKELRKILEDSFETNIDVINKNVYQNNRANVFLAEYFPFIIATKEHPLIQQVIEETLDEFINLHIKSFNKYNKVEINFIGSVAYFLSDEIKYALQRKNLRIGEIRKDPIRSLIQFHFKKIKEIRS